MTPEERNKVPGFPDVWVDVGFKTKEEAEKWVRDVDEPNARLIDAGKTRTTSFIDLD